jgi:uncharacterized protein YprB with RNaseH-like and TPR domain
MRFLVPPGQDGWGGGGNASLLRAVEITDPRPLEEVVPGQRHDLPEGSYYFVRRDYAVCYHLGGRPLEQARVIAGETLAALARDQRLANLTLDEAVFLDTETTGLSAGAGTHVFLVGLGYFVADYFRLDQYFMEDYDQEPGLLAALQEGLRSFRAVISFNGKAFDLPLLEARFILARQRSPLSSHPHLDLLSAARRLWGARLPSCRLVALEEAILGETRVGDLPGALVPEHYFRYLRTRDPWLVKPIFDHNRQDVLTLLSLVGRAAARYESFLSDPPREKDLDPLDLYGLARLYRVVGRQEPAVRSYLAGLEAGLPPELAGRAALDCIRTLRRLGRSGEATLLCASLADAHPQGLWALLELAKDLEHRVRDYRGALAVVERALGLLAGKSEVHARHCGGMGSNPTLGSSRRYGRARLARKQARGRTRTPT